MGLPALTAEDRRFLVGCALAAGDRFRSARATLETVATTHPLALDLLFRAELALAADGQAVRAAFARAAAQPRAAVELAATLLGQGPLSTCGHHAAALSDHLATLPPRPQLTAHLAVVAAMDSLRARPHTLAEVATRIDTLHRAHPREAGVFLDDLVHAARTWHGAGALLTLFEPRAEWMAPRRRARAHAWLLAADQQTHAAYRRVLPLAGTPDAAPPGILVEAGGSWHPHAAELTGWARAVAAHEYQPYWTLLADLLREHGDTAAADSLRTEVAREIPREADHERARRLAITEPAEAAALAHRWTDVFGEQAMAGVLVELAGRRGDHVAVDRLLAAWGPTAETSLLHHAVHAAAAIPDTARLRELAQRILATRPDHVPLLGLIASRCGQAGDHDTASRLIDVLAAHPFAPRDLFGTRIDTAVHAGRPEAARQALADYLAADTNLPDELLMIPVYAEAAGWSSLADTALARLQAAAPAAPAVVLTEGRMLTRRGEHRAARDVLLPLGDAWPERAAVREAVIAAGGAVETYREPDPLATAAGFGGLPLGYADTDWITARRAAPGDYPEADVVVLRDRHTYHLASRQQLRHRRHLTVQILRGSGASIYETVRTTFAADHGQPRVLAARVITAEGEVREVPRASIMITSPQDDTADVSEARDLVIPFSGVQPGAVVDYCLEQELPGFLGLGQAFEYYFGFGVPQQEERLEVIVADGVAARIHDDHAPVPAERSEVPGGTLHTWLVRDAAPMDYDQDAPLAEVLAHRVGVTTYDDWNRLAAAYGEQFWSQTAGSEDLCALARDLTAGAPDDLARVTRLYEHLQSGVSNVGIELGDGRFVPTPATEVLARGYGDCKDKVATLTALLACLDIECLPVLVGTRPSLPVEEDFPYSGRFDHLIAHVPDVAGGVFCDPTLGGECLTGLSADVLGLEGLLIDPDGEGHMVRIPDRNLAQPLLALEVDLYPEAGGRLRAEVLARVRGTTAQNAGGAFDLPDTSVHRYMAHLVAGNHASESLQLVSWQKRTLGCDWFEIAAVLRDSTWANPDDHDASVVWVGAPDDDLELVAPAGRELGVSLGTPQRFQSRIRAHEGAGWRITDIHAPIRVQAPDYRGEVTVDLREEDGRRWLEIAREERYTRRTWSAADYARVHDQILSYRVATYQPIRYQRQGDPGRIAQLRDYCRQNPDDLDFAVQAAMQILGGDMGGRGDAGRERRAVARELLVDVLARPEVGGVPFLLGAGIAVADEHYLEADSLLTVGLERSPRDAYLLGTAVDVKTELGDCEAVVALYERAQEIFGGAGLGYTLIAQYLGNDQDELAERQIQRLGLLTAEVDSVQLALNRLQGYLESGRIAEARVVLAGVEDALPPHLARLCRADIHARVRQWEEAIDALSTVQNDRPLDTALNNNLSWYLACAGRELDRAEYLVRMSLALSDDAGSQNTLAVVMLQQGRVQEARDLFRELMEDDRPPVRVTNGYFLGLCHWRRGDRDRAVDLWRELDALAVGDEFGDLIGESLAAVDAGEDPSWLYLRQPTPGP